MFSRPDFSFSKLADSQVKELWLILQHWIILNQVEFSRCMVMIKSVNSYKLCERNIAFI